MAKDKKKGLGRSVALGYEPSLPGKPRGSLVLCTSGKITVLLLQERPLASRKVRFSSTEQRSHVKCHQLW